MTEPADFADTFRPSKIHFRFKDADIWDVNEIPHHVDLYKSRPVLLVFDKHAEDPDQYAMEIDCLQLLNLAHSVLRWLDPSVEYETLRTLKSLDESATNILIEKNC